MADRTCERCRKAFKYPAHLARHRARVTQCAPIIDREELPPEILEDPSLEHKRCRFCGRVFSSYDAMRRHVRNSCKIAPNNKNGDTGMELLYEHTLQRQLDVIQDENAEMRAQVAELNGLIRQLVAGGGAAITNAGDSRIPAAQIAGDGGVQIGGDGQVAIDNKKINVVNNVDNRVTINVFGQESIEHVTSSKIRDILDDSLKSPAIPLAAQTAIMKTAMLIYSDPEHPENLTCFLPNKKTNDALVHTENGWEIQSIMLVASPIAQRTIDALFAKQPFEDADTYENLMANLRDNEEKYAAGESLRPVLVRNKDLLQRALQTLPLAGAE